MSEEKSAPDAAAVDAAEPVTRSIDEAGPAIPRQSTADVAAPATDPEPLPVRTPAPVAEAPRPESAVKTDEKPDAKSEVRAGTFDDGEPMVALATEPPKRGRGVLLTLLIALAVLIVVAVVGFLVVQKIYTDPTRDAKAGDCLTSLPVVDPGQDEAAPGAKIVACDDAAATHSVEGRLDNQSAEQARNNQVCAAYPDANFIYRAVPDNGNGYVLCLKKLTP